MERTPETAVWARVTRLGPSRAKIFSHKCPRIDSLRAAHILIPPLNSNLVRHLVQPW